MTPEQVAGSRPVGSADSVPARTVVNITRWVGRPTSGRLVYRGTASGVWSWQCDLHGDNEDEMNDWGGGGAWRYALAGALAHAAVCPFVSASRVR